MLDDTKNSTKNKLPRYAQHANPARLVLILCKGDCGRTAWAEMNVDYPGREVLWRSQVGDFRATCLRCGKTALDPYNWLRTSFSDKSRKPNTAEVKGSSDHNANYLAIFNELAEGQKACLLKLYDSERRLGIPIRKLNLVSKEYGETRATIHKLQSCRLNCEKEGVRKRLDKQIKEARVRLQSLRWLQN